MFPILGILASQITGHLQTSNFESIQTVTVGVGGQSSATFSAIPADWTHLQLRILARSDRSVVTNDYMELTFNSDTAANYSYHQLLGDGSTTSANSGVTQNNILASRISTTSSGTSRFGAVIIDILDYANTSKYKTTRSLGGQDLNGGGQIYLNSGNWRNTAAITDISITPSGSNIFVEYSQIALYGVK